MYARMETPTIAELGSLYRTLSSWQHSSWAGQLHSGDLGWHSTVGPQRMAADLRVWARRRVPVAIGLIDGGEVLRMGFAPDVLDDYALACGIADDLMNCSCGIFAGDTVIVEARGAHALMRILQQRGWCDDAPWMPLVASPNRSNATNDTGVYVQQAELDDASEWAAVHWSAFKEAPCDTASFDLLCSRIKHIFDGLFAEHCKLLIARDDGGTAVAVACVWFAGDGRPGLIEPMGVHADYRGRGHGKAITLAAVEHLTSWGSSSAVVVAEVKNPGALAAYESAGFASLGEVCDLKWVASAAQ